MKSNKTSGIETGRRSFLKKTSYIAPAILTMTALPSFASIGSGPMDPDGTIRIRARKKEELSLEAKKQAVKTVAKARKKAEQAVAKAKQKAKEASPEAKKKAEKKADKAVAEARKIIKNLGS